MGALKKTPSKDDFCEKDTPSLLIVEVSQDYQGSFCDNESHELLQLTWLLSILNYMDHINNVKRLLLRHCMVQCWRIFYVTHGTENIQKVHFYLGYRRFIWADAIYK